MTIQEAVTGYPLEAEAGVIGSMLMDPRCVGLVLSRVRSDDFSPGNVPIVAAISALFGERQRLDAVTVLDQMRRMGSYREETRRQVLELVDITPTAAHVEEYVAIVAEQARLRQVRQLAAGLTGAVSVAEAGRALEQIASALRDEEREDVEDLATGIDKLHRWLEDEQPVQYLPTGLRRLDRQLQLEKGMYVILAGNPSDGKTLLAVQMALSMARESKVGFFSCETSLSRLMRRIVPCFAGISASRLRQKALTKEEFLRLVRKNGELAQLKLERIHSSGYTVADIRALTAARGYDVIFVDYLQIVRPDNPKDPDVRQLQMISRQLHELAQSLGVLVVCLCQYSWETQKQARTPRVCDLKGASEIEQNADVILLLSKTGLNKGGGEDWEDRVDEDTLEPGTELRLLQIAKNKDGDRGGWMHLLLQGDMQRMVPYWPPGQSDSPPPPQEPPEPEWVQTAMDDEENWEELPQ